MIIQVCKFHRFPEGGGQVSFPAGQIEFPDLRGLGGAETETRDFSSFYEFASNGEIHAGADLHLWLNAAHVVDRQIVQSCVDAHQSHGATGTTFHSKIEFEEEWQQIVYGNVPHEWLIGWENPRLSCYASGKFLSPVAPLMLDGPWASRFSTWLRKRLSKQEADIIGMSDYVSAMLGRLLRNDKKKLRLVPSPFLKLKLGDGLNGTPDFRVRGLIRELCVQASERYQPLPTKKVKKQSYVKRALHRISSSMSTDHPFDQSVSIEPNQIIRDMPFRTPSDKGTNYHDAEMDSIASSCAEIPTIQLIAELRRVARLGMPKARVSWTRLTL